MHAATIALLQQRLAVLSPVRSDVEDQSALHAGHPGAQGGAHLRLTIVSAVFSGKNTRSRHRLVYDAAGDLLRGKIHALTIETHAPEEI